MRRGGRESGSIEDRRGGGGIGSVPLVLRALFFGVDPSVILSDDHGRPPAQAQRAKPGSSDEGRRFAAQVLAETEDVRAPRLRARGRRCEPPRLVLCTAWCSAPVIAFSSRCVTATRCAAGAGWRAFTISPSGACTVIGR
jgi:predicted metalloprotease